MDLPVVDGWVDKRVDRRTLAETLGVLHVFQTDG